MIHPCNLASRAEVKCYRVIFSRRQCEVLDAHAGICRRKRHQRAHGAGNLPASSSVIKKETAICLRVLSFGLSLSLFCLFFFLFFFWPFENQAQLRVKNSHATTKYTAITCHYFCKIQMHFGSICECVRPRCVSRSPVWRQLVWQWPRTSGRLLLLSLCWCWSGTYCQRKTPNLEVKDLVSFYKSRDDSLPSPVGFIFPFPRPSQFLIINFFFC